MRVVFIYMAGCPTSPVSAAAGHATSSSSGILPPCATDLPCPCLGGVPYAGSSRSKEKETRSSEMSQLKICLKKIPPQNEKKLHWMWKHLSLSEGISLSSQNCWLWAPQLIPVSLISLFLLITGYQNHFTDLGRVWHPDFKERLRGK